MKIKWMMLALVALCGMAQAALVTIGNAGNAADTDTGYGAVGYTYQISATEVTIAEFTASGAGNGNENWWNDGTRTVGPQRSGLKCLALRSDEILQLADQWQHQQRSL